jgi:hypothetical protein
MLKLGLETKHMGVILNADNILLEKSERKRPPGRPRHGW